MKSHRTKIRSAIARQIEKRQRESDHDPEQARLLRISPPGQSTSVDDWSYAASSRWAKRFWPMRKRILAFATSCARRVC